MAQFQPFDLNVHIFQYNPTKMSQFYTKPTIKLHPPIPKHPILKSVPELGDPQVSAPEGGDPHQTRRCPAQNLVSPSFIQTLFLQVV